MTLLQMTIPGGLALGVILIAFLLLLLLPISIAYQEYKNSTAGAENNSALLTFIEDNPTLWVLAVGGLVVLALFFADGTGLPYWIPTGSEGVVGFLFLLALLPLYLAYWVYEDASSRGEDNPALWAIAIIGLTVLTIVGGIAVFIVYLMIRDSEPHKASSAN
jgi:hypothetical protein